MKTLEHLKVLTDGHFSGDKKCELRHQQGRVVAVFPVLVAPVFRDGQFIGWYVIENPLFLVEKGGDYYLFDRRGKAALHPYVNNRGEVRRGVRRWDVQGVVEALLVVDADRGYFEPPITLERPELKENLQPVYYL
jgi:hypothetical protein